MSNRPNKYGENLNHSQLIILHIVDDISTGAFRFDFLLALTVGFFWLKVLFLLRLTRTFGPLIKIIFAMVEQLMTFCVIWFVQIIFFACVAMMIFGEMKVYNNFIDSVILLLESSLGQWDMNMYDGLSLGKYVGVIFHCFFLLMNLVMLLNLIIAILSNVYDTYQPKSLALYYDGVIESIPMFKYNKEYGSLICGQPPFNALVFPFIWAYSYMDGTEKTRRYNQLLLNILYFPIAVALIGIFIAGNLAMLPFAYIWSILHKINIFFKDMQRSKLEMTLELLFFIIVGPVFLFISQFRDLFYFVQQLYTQKIDKLSSYKRPNMSIKGLMLLLNLT